jgi:hypothetical protein
LEYHNLMFTFVTFWRKIVKCYHWINWKSYFETACQSGKYLAVMYHKNYFKLCNMFRWKRSVNSTELLLVFLPIILVIKRQ